ncbi:putative 2-aminoethylphosphonate ABC transporter ATP-binding protein [Paenibacillus sp. LHD-38]|uniref:putative 2-aminoethylphosphonate ABC transporter ATP-binding protein n=1 Tax=Paenibacillus sp. LHD-38 TaxID=3072143 RepID=UPI0028105AE2|nr:putative 2-aminoethylphosphonate ABC transporter ATP-binding protein [Paenibacillus sp. LHD-38]MDQ8735209.1 putative 2-aminoethylphosphonate ABC transporter ATP-binding protein [Paenibacillus sp. LHD-38]
MRNDGLAINGIRKTFGSFQALQDVNVHIPKGKFTCLLGPSGCGKTTLLRIIAGLEQADTGTVMQDGKDISMLPTAKRNFGIVFQSYALFPNLTVSENIGYGLKGKQPKRQIEERVKEMLELIGLTAIRERFPAQLSGGQQQRVALARAIALSPDILLLDEPLSALDAKVREKLREQLCELQERLGITTVMVTHDQEEALTMADQIVVMDHGQVVQIGTPQEVYDKPKTPFVADFIGAINFFPAGTARWEGAGPNDLLAIRPEHIQIDETQGSADEQREDGISGFVQHVEFRGAFYRVSLQLANELGRHSDMNVTVDISSQTANRYDWSRNKLLHLHLPQERMLHYPAAGAGIVEE